MATSKSKGKISASAASKSYNQKTLAKIKARDAAKSGSSTTSSKSTPIDYTFNSKTETPAQYNARIAAARGDSSTELAAQNATLAGKTDSSGNFNAATLATAKAQLAAAAAPTNPEAINPAVADTKLPEGTPAAGDISAPVSTIAGMQAYNKAEQARLLKQEETRQAEQAKTQKSFFDSMLSPLKAKEAAQKETGIDVGDYFAKQEKGIKEIESLTKDYNAVVAARDSQIAQANDKMASMNFINNQTAQIERNAAPKLNEISANVNAKTATLQAEQGNFAEARSYVNQAVLDATADNKFKYDMYTTMYEENKDNFDRIDSIYANSFKNAMDLALAEYEQAVKDKELIGEYMLKYPSAGLKMSDSIEEASRKIGSVAKTTGVGSAEAQRRAKMVLNGQAALTDYTTAEQADIRDAIWGMDTSTAGYTGQYPMSYAPGALDAEFNTKKMSVAGPGTGIIDKGTTVTDSNYSAGLNYLYTQGAAAGDIEKYKTDPDFRDWAIAKASVE